jgi:molybdate-binding protein
MGLLRCYRNNASWVVVRCVQRAQGLVVSNARMPDLSLSNANHISDMLGNRELRWAMRQNDSGTERLLEDLCSGYGLSTAHLNVSTQCNSEISAVAAVNTGAADICCGLQCTAKDFALGFLPAAQVSLDLVMSRKTYFRTLMQDFIKRLHDADALNMATTLEGYTLLRTAELVTLDC